jgi:ABC-type sugar transport system substrate-binding protein
MRDLQRIGLALTTTLALIQPAFAAEMVSDGEMAAAIRSADYPCKHVLEVQATGDNRWRVQCNSGTYQVNRDANGQFTVVKTNWPAG